MTKESQIIKEKREELKALRECILELGALKRNIKHNTHKGLINQFEKLSLNEGTYEEFNKKINQYYQLRDRNKFLKEH